MLSYKIISLGLRLETEIKSIIEQSKKDRIVFGYFYTK